MQVLIYRCGVLWKNCMDRLLAYCKGDFIGDAQGLLSQTQSLYDSHYDSVVIVTIKRFIYWMYCQLAINPNQCGLFNSFCGGGGGGWEGEAISSSRPCRKLKFSGYS